MATVDRETLLGVDEVAVRIGARRMVRPLSFALAAGDRLVILGESGAGKSLLLKALMGALPAGASAEGRVRLVGEDSRADDGARRRPRWGRTLGWLPQEPSVALDPLRRLKPQLSEVLRKVAGRPAREAEAEATSTLAGLGLAPFERHYAWQISGGMAQRAAAAIALAGGARLVLADEPTKGLDPAWRDSAIDRLLEIAADGGAVLVVTHDLQVARRVGGRLMVMRDGEVVESGPTDEVLARPGHAFTRALIESAPSNWTTAWTTARSSTSATSATSAMSAMSATAAGGTLSTGRSVTLERSRAPVLRARGLGHGWDGRWLFRGVALELHAGDRLALQGDSGCGKSTLGNVLLGLVRPREGRVLRSPHLAPHALQKLYQDPLSSFAPGQTLGEALDDVRRRHRQSKDAVDVLLERLLLDRGLLRHRPKALSGGQLQRMAIARALLARPALLFADEPTSRLDLVTQRRTAELLSRTVAEEGTALLLVTHDADLAVALTDRQIRMAEWSGAGGVGGEGPSAAVATPSTATA